MYNKKGDSVLYVKRFMTDGDKYLDLAFKVTTDTLGIIEQKFTGKSEYANEDDLKKSKLQLNDYDWQPRNVEKVLFVQVQPEAFESEIDALTKRGPIEMNISDQLKAQGSGQWIAGDIGPGGANMLFDVTDWEKGMDIIMKVLKEQKLETKTVIARRLIISDEDWFYEVIYPQQFTGYFNTF
ncbi:MAG TPA: hypothetical protein VHM26_03900 [Chitinophagaceae bacterium]|nr:hypothetical protein [Chitinophagaceae bacterium]